MKDTTVFVSLFGVSFGRPGAKGRHFGRYLASFLQVEFVGCWSATESDALSGQVRGFVWWSLEAFRGLIIWCISGAGKTLSLRAHPCRYRVALLQDSVGSFH